MNPGEDRYIPLLVDLLPELVHESPGASVLLMDLYTELLHVAAAAGKPFMPLGVFVRCMRSLGYPRTRRGSTYVVNNLRWIDADLAAEIASNRAKRTN
ncbi:hypothetical protein [Streptomyces sp. LN500]|uniref:hypothetical protein n=1 Tax=Streptomyces sp. LN500 TaxID=3112978 RepID=UPI00371EC2A3